MVETNGEQRHLNFFDLRESGGLELSKELNSERNRFSLSFTVNLGKVVVSRSDLL